MFQNNAVNNLFLTMNQLRQVNLGLAPYNNLQLLAILMASHGGVSDYHAMVATLRNRPWEGLQFDMNYTLASSKDQLGDVQNNLALITTGFDPNVDYGPSQADRRHVFNAIVNYQLPFGSGKRWSSGNGLVNEVIGGWYFSGIYRAYSSLPLFVTDNNGVFGGSLSGLATGAIPLGDPNSLGAGIHDGVVGSGGVGTAGNPANANPGSGLNLFADPEAAYRAFRRIELSRDTKSGRTTPFRGPGFWNLDFRIGKDTAIGSKVRWELSVDFFNVFNHFNFSEPPSLTLNNPASFGVITGQSGSPRAIQLGSRFRSRLIRLGGCHRSAQGLKTGFAKGAKSDSFRVTMVRSCTSAVAATNASIALIARPERARRATIRPQASATPASMISRRASKRSAQSRSTTPDLRPFANPRLTSCQRGLELSTPNTRARQGGRPPGRRPPDRAARRWC